MRLKEILKMDQEEAHMAITELLAEFTDHRNI